MYIAWEDQVKIDSYCAYAETISFCGSRPNFAKVVPSIHPNFIGSSIFIIVERWECGRILKRRIDDGGDSEDGVLVSQ